jgi:hypothetical protein
LVGLGCTDGSHDQIARGPFALLPVLSHPRFGKFFEFEHGQKLLFADLASPLDGLTAMNDFGLMPNQPKPTTTPECPTKGAEIGSRLRARANKLSDTAREVSRLRGMQLIYGNGSGNKVHAPGR